MIIKKLQKPSEAINSLKSFIFYLKRFFWNTLKQKMNNLGKLGLLKCVKAGEKIWACV